jgi:putative SOS response-associated peptidase YedK
MCGRFTETAAFDVLAERFGITVEDSDLEDLAPRYNVSSSQPVPIITASDTGHCLTKATWGFRPAWVKNSKLAPINARAETVATSRRFAAAVRNGRCLVPATGFYEWKPVLGKKRKQPYFIRLKGGAPFAFAGLWTPPHLAPPTCTVITTTPNELCAPIHNRMPVILDPDDETLWLDPGAVAPAKGLAMPAPVPIGADGSDPVIIARVVSKQRRTALNRAGPDVSYAATKPRKTPARSLISDPIVVLVERRVHPLTLGGSLAETAPIATG